MKITIYELLGMVKDGKTPRKFKYDDFVWTYNYESSAYWNGKSIEFEDYMDDGLMKYLDDEVEILEEEKKIPEKLADILRVDDLIPPVDENMYKIWTQTIKNQNKINAIIDYLEIKGDE